MGADRADEEGDDELERLRLVDIADGVLYAAEGVGSLGALPRALDVRLEESCELVEGLAVARLDIVGAAGIVAVLGRGDLEGDTILAFCVCSTMWARVNNDVLHLLDEFDLTKWHIIKLPFIPDECK